VSHFHAAPDHEAASTIAELEPLFAAHPRSESLPARPGSRDLPASAPAGDRKSLAACPEAGRLPVAFVARLPRLQQPSPPKFSWKSPGFALHPDGPNTRPLRSEPNNPQIHPIPEAVPVDRHARGAPNKASPPCAPRSPDP